VGLAGVIKSLFKKPEANLTIIYTPGKGIEFDNQTINWDMDRLAIRTMLNNSHEESDILYELSEFFDGDTSRDIEVRRDIYSNYKCCNISLFLNYSTKNILQEIEVHEGAVIHIHNITVIFDVEASKLAQRFKTQGHQFKETSEEDYFFPDLRMTFASKRSMGGDGAEVGYFYCAKDVSHITEEIIEVNNR